MTTLEDARRSIVQVLNNRAASFLSLAGDGVQPIQETTMNYSNATSMPFTPQDIRVARLILNLDQVDLARVLDVTRQQIRDWGRGEDTLSAELVRRLDTVVLIARLTFLGENQSMGSSRS